MGRQAWVFHGVAQFSKDIDLLLLADDANYTGLHRALEELRAVRIAIQRFDPALLERGHGVLYRCKSPVVDGLKEDIMTNLRDLPTISELWQRHSSLTLDDQLACRGDGHPGFSVSQEGVRNYATNMIFLARRNWMAGTHSINPPLTEVSYGNYRWVFFSSFSKFSSFVSN